MGIFIGVMSGTSLDGIDIAIAHIDEHKFELIAEQTYEFTPDLRLALLALINNEHITLAQLGQTDIALGHAYAKAILSLMNKAEISASQVVAIGCHGQTIHHAPNSPYPFSMQIGNGNVIAELTGITTITDFRQRDMVLGGQGAPLVPAFHKYLFQDVALNRVIANIGGISNITLLPSDQSHPIQGYDTGPGNGLMDQWFSLHQGGHYDAAGEWARSGQVEQSLLKQLLADPYFSEQAPKSTGREYFNLNWLNTQLETFARKVTAEDVQRTLLALTTTSLCDAIHQSFPHCDEVYVCGGGAHNTLLMEELHKLLNPTQLKTTNELGLSVDGVEACAFAWLAKQTIESKVGNLPSVTGANKSTILGAIYSSNDAS